MVMDEDILPRPMIPIERDLYRVLELLLEIRDLLKAIELNTYR